MNSETTIHILQVEDNPTDVLLTEAALESEDFHIRSTERLIDALELLVSDRFDVVLLDLGLPDSQGLDTLRKLRQENRQIPVVVMTGSDDEASALLAMQEGAQDYLVKGNIDSGPLKRSLRYAIERSGAERKLRQSEERLMELTAHIHQVLWVIDAKDNKVLYISKGYERIFGRSCQSILDDPSSYMDGVHPLDREMMVREHTASLQTGYIDLETRIVRPDSSVRWVWIRGYPVLKQGEIVRLVGVVEDITEKKLLATERDELLARMQLHIERLPLAYIRFDQEFHIIDWNLAAERIFGFTKEEIFGERPPHQKLVPESSCQQVKAILDRVRSGDMDAHSTYENLTKDGRFVTCEWNNTPLFEDGKFYGMISLVQDITARKALQLQFEQAQKMEVVGLLAGGVAHDFNNMLAVIMGNCKLLEGDRTLSDDSRESAENVQKAALQAAALTRQLLAFSRRQILRPKILNLNEIVTEAVAMLGRLIGEDIALKTILHGRLWSVKVDAGQMSQVIMNLAVNARDAMPDGGSITVETANVELDATHLQAIPEAKAGQYVVMSITDTGCGMDQETKARMFDPFFTTKETGKGTGLGLSTTFGIVKQSGGFISCGSEVGKGATFKVYLPRDESVANANPTIEPQHALPRGTETILLVEDEGMLRTLTARILSGQGYAVLKAKNGHEALQVYERHGGTIHLLLTDVVMPALGGPELFDRLRVIQPDLKVLYTSGYTDDKAIRHGVCEAVTNFIEKPFSSEELSVKVRNVLDQVP